MIPPTEQERAAFWVKAHDNRERLQGCTYHIFVPLRERMGVPGRYRCQTCGGILTPIQKLWFDQGVLQGSSPCGIEFQRKMERMNDKKRKKSRRIKR